MNAATHESSAAASCADLLIGTNFRAIRKLGECSMGLVVEAENLALGTVVVVKLLHAALAPRADYVDRLRLEAQALGRVRHPNLVMVTDFSVTPAGVPFLVMERLQGRTVDEERRMRGALPVGEAIDIVRQTLAGLAAVHEAGIIHRDIKSANLFLCDAGASGLRVVKVLDFGIAKVLSSAPAGRAPQPLRFPTAEGAAVGTPRCLSPEQACCRPVDARTDVYAVGLLLYTLIAGRGPFDHLHGALELLDAHANVVPVAPSLLAAQPIPPGVEAAILRALAKRPEDRFSSASEFAEALGAATIPPSATRPLRSAAKTPRRFDTEPLSTTSEGDGPTIWIPPVPVVSQRPPPASADAGAVVDGHPPIAAPISLVTSRTPGLALSILIVTLSAFASATLAALLAWVCLFRR